MSYQTSRNWADAYLPQQNQIACGLLLEKNLISVVFTPPTYAEDAISGVDTYIDISRLKLAYRVRKQSDHDYWRKGFTLRTSKKNGHLSELEKVMAQSADYADYLLYSVADDEPGQLMCSCLIDLKSCGAQLVAYPEILNKAHFGNGFVDLPYELFPDHIVMGIH
ncbi:hypothetical protein [Thiobacillus sp.]|uniref:hypothetical protein n=1 Tax=Thiobacillus sp. TaxID=924 RepID=UPI0025E5E0B9|nr:hypothetical protein [Thiobacillus sp.]MBT9540383.1 hypothetical protein [Thiobacillus sp.]